MCAVSYIPSPFIYYHRKCPTMCHQRGVSTECHDTPCGGGRQAKLPRRHGLPSSLPSPAAMPESGQRTLGLGNPRGLLDFLMDRMQFYTIAGAQKSEGRRLESSGAVVTLTDLRGNCRKEGRSGRRAACLAEVTEG